MKTEGKMDMYTVIMNYLHCDLDNYEYMREKLREGKGSYTARPGTSECIHYEDWGCGVICAWEEEYTSFGNEVKHHILLHMITEDDEFYCIPEDSNFKDLKSNLDCDASYVDTISKAFNRMYKWLEENCNKSQHGFYTTFKRS